MTFEYVLVFCFLLCTGFILAIINRYVALLMTRKSFYSYLKSANSFEYVKLKYLSVFEKDLSKERQKNLVIKMFFNNTKLMIVSLKPIIVQFIILIVALKLIRTTFNDFDVSISIFSWQLTWFSLYFASYLITSISLTKMLGDSK